MTRRVLILAASAGAGHNRAAEALQAACAEYHPEVASQWADALKYTPRLFRRFYEQSYLWMANHAPTLYGLLYKFSGKKVRPRADRIVHAYDHLSYRRLVRFIDKCAPDVVVATHFLAPNVIIAHKGKRLPVYTVVTDYDVHPAWFNADVAGYFVPTEEVKVQLARMGIPETRIRVTGIPIHPVFSKPHGAARRALKLRDDLPVVLFMSGGFGVGDMGTAVERLTRIPRPYQLVVV
ncbi:MAG: galactosyldiacylglycerol synthase, partial [Planctomycetes bacterium]|nr:galactosyldiacylglycerol synthase [Planctomycetota bacterium]